MKKLTLTGLLVLFFGFGCFARQKVDTSTVCISELEYEVYNTVGITNFQNTTRAEPVSDYVQAQLEGLSSETVADFRQKNRSSYVLSCLSREAGKTTQLPQSTNENASISFSRTGFNRDKDEGLLYILQSGNYCEAQFLLLKKNVGTWKVVKRVTTLVC